MERQKSKKLIVLKSVSCKYILSLHLVILFARL